MPNIISNNNYCIILCGGEGNRLWPYSRSKKPKQFLDLLGIGQSMLQITYNRLSRIVPKENIFFATHKDYVAEIQQQLPQIAADKIIAEHVSLGTSPATALSSVSIYRENPNANVLVTPSDQLILNEEDFRQQITQCFQLVESSANFIVIGVKPTRPETSYGYIQEGEQAADNFYKVKSFTEKPALEFANMFCESGEFCWSTGLFLFKMKHFVEAYSETHPNFDVLIRKIDAGISEKEINLFIAEQFPRTLFESLDMLILEKCTNVYVKSCSFGWADIGNWNNLYAISQKGNDGNVLMNSTAELYESHNNIINVQDKIVLAKGLEGYMVVETDNTLVICPKDDTSLLRRIQTDAKMKYGDEIG